MQITKQQTMILSLLVLRQGGQYEADLVKISHGALARASIRAQLVGLAGHDCVRREYDASMYTAGGSAPARWFITDTGRKTEASTRSLKALGLLHQCGPLPTT